jgi:hypothetical protein
VFNQTTVVLDQGEGTAWFTGTQSGIIPVNITGDGLSSAQTRVHVLPAIKAVKLDVDGSTASFVPATVSFAITGKDVYDNFVFESNDFINFTATDTAGEIVISTRVQLVNGRCNLTSFFRLPGEYTIRAWSDKLAQKIVSFFGVLDKTVDNIVDFESGYGKIKVTIPKNTFDKDAVFSITKKNVSVAGLKVLSKDKETLIENCKFRITAKTVNGTEIDDTSLFGQNKKITLTIPYPDIDNNGIIDDTKLLETNLRVVRFENGSWAEPASASLQLDSSKNTVTVMVNKLGVYSVLGVTTEPIIESVVVYPNPFTDNTEIGFNVGSQGEITMNIYTVTGRLIRTMNKQVTQDGYVSFSFDGKNSKDEPIANGTYIFKITGANAGKTYTKIGKLVKTE